VVREPVGAGRRPIQDHCVFASSVAHEGSAVPAMNAAVATEDQAMPVGSEPLARSPHEFIIRTQLGSSTNRPLLSSADSGRT